jgi:60 kDa SS-A/Ro ribonucleoprotein
VHPIALLAALRTYQAGRGARGRGEWNPVREVVDALDAAFYTAFENVEPTGKRLLLALDVSGSMTSGSVAGVPHLSPRDASAALALVTAASEERYEIVGFAAGRRGWKSDRKGPWDFLNNGLTPLAISPRRPSGRCDQDSDGPSVRRHGLRAADALRTREGAEVDTFVIYTDSETWAGELHPAQVSSDYRRASGIEARLVVVGMVSNGFSIADPTDPGMLDVVGFDTATPQLIAQFASGVL